MRDGAEEHEALQTEDARLLGHLSEVRAVCSWAPDSRHDAVTAVERTDAPTLRALDDEEDTWEVKQRYMSV